MFNASRLKHQFSGCPCGHPEHTGNGLRALEGIVCAKCDEIAASEKVILSIVSANTAEAEGIAAGIVVSYGGKTHRVVKADQITKLGGAYVTPWVLLRLKEVA